MTPVTRAPKRHRGGDHPAGDPHRVTESPPWETSPPPADPYETPGDGAAYPAPWSPAPAEVGEPHPPAGPVPDGTVLRIAEDQPHLPPAGPWEGGGHHLAATAPAPPAAEPARRTGLLERVRAAEAEEGLRIDLTAGSAPAPAVPLAPEPPPDPFDLPEVPVAEPVAAPAPQPEPAEAPPPSGVLRMADAYSPPTPAATATSDVALLPPDPWALPAEAPAVAAPPQAAATAVIAAPPAAPEAAPAAAVAAPPAAATVATPPAPPAVPLRRPVRVAPPALPAKLLRATRLGLGFTGLMAVYLTTWLVAWALVPTLVLGWQSVVITSGSMGPSIDTGDVVVAAPHDGSLLGPGTVVVFEDSDSAALTTHRIVETTPDGGYLTRGDANPRPDSTPLEPDRVVGVGRLLVPRAGLPLVWYSTGAWVKLAAWGLLILAGLWAAASTTHAEGRDGRA